MEDRDSGLNLTRRRTLKTIASTSAIGMGSITSFSDFASATHQDGLIAYYPLDEPADASTAQDESGHDRDGTINGATLGVSGQIETAYDFS